MFSGGLDSLAGAVESAANGSNLILVSHRPVSVLSSRQADLFANLQKAFPKSKMKHVPVWVNKDGDITREFSQRTRSFLFFFPNPSAFGGRVGGVDVRGDFEQVFEPVGQVPFEPLRHVVEL